MPTQPPRKPDVSVTPQPKTPSEWSARPIPAPGPGRSTADPKTPTKRELAARAQKASAVADATRVAPRPPEPPSAMRLANDPLAYAAHLEALEAARQNGTIADKVRRRAERAALVARGRAAAGGLPSAQGAELRTASDRLAQFSSDIELARLSKDMYRAPGEGQPPLGWTRSSDDLDQLPAGLRDPKLWRDDASGFAAGLYREAPELGGRTVLAYRGTANTPGWITDGAQAFGLKTKQYDETAQLARAVRRQLGPDVLVTGHSLGGGEATLASAMAGLRGATFNPSGLHPATAAEYNTTPQAAADLLSAYHVPGEALTALQSSVGRSLLDPLAGGVKRGIVAGQSILEGRWPTARELDTAHIPPSIGRHVTLPNPGGPSPLPIPASPLGLGNPVAGGVAAARGLLTSGVRHMGIFPIHAMELQKDQDRATIESLAPRARGTR